MTFGRSGLADQYNFFERPPLGDFIQLGIVRSRRTRMTSGVVHELNHRHNSINVREAWGTSVQGIPTVLSPAGLLDISLEAVAKPGQVMVPHT